MNVKTPPFRRTIHKCQQDRNGAGENEVDTLPKDLLVDINSAE